MSGFGLWGSNIGGASDPTVGFEIAEIDYNPPGNDEPELVVIRNPGAESIDMSGFQVRDESSVNRS